MPNEGEEGYIEALDFGWVLGIKGDAISNSEVVLEPKNSSNDINQKWTRSFVNEHGYFTFRTTNGLYLSVDSKGNPYIEGKI